MKVVVELTKEDIEVLRKHQESRMDWIQAGMDEKEPFDFVVQKVLNAADKSAQDKQEAL